MHHFVNIADMKIAAYREDSLVAYALGSCLGIAIYDPVSCVGGLLHVMLPASTINPVKARTMPCMFIDTGVPKLFIACYEAGARKERLEVKVAGGARRGASEEEDRFQIGKRNFLTLKKLLWKNNVLIHSQDVGGCHTRTMSLDIGSGTVRVKVDGKEKVL